VTDAVNRLHEDGYDLGIPLCAGAGVQAPDRLIKRKGRAIRPVRSHGVEGIHDAQDTRHEGNLVAGERVDAAATGLDLRSDCGALRDGQRAAGDEAQNQEHVNRVDVAVAVHVIGADAVARRREVRDAEEDLERVKRADLIVTVRVALETSM
jgi:hypothetical protein